MSRQELADEINAFLYSGAGTYSTPNGGIDAKYIGKLERGVYRWPNEHYRKAFRAVLKAGTDAELGFYIRRQPRPERSPVLRRTLLRYSLATSLPAFDVLQRQRVLEALAVPKR